MPDETQPPQAPEPKEIDKQEQTVDEIERDLYLLKAIMLIQD